MASSAATSAVAATSAAATTTAAITAATSAATSFNGSSMLAFENPEVIYPTKQHLATIVWLHACGEDGKKVRDLLLKNLQLPHVKMICPTALYQVMPQRFGSTPVRAWFIIGKIEKDAPDDLEGLDLSAAYVARLLANEPPGVKLGVGGFDMGGSVALHCASCFALGRYANGSPYPPINFEVVVSLSGWLHGAWRLRHMDTCAKKKVSSLPVLICHGEDDKIIPFSCAKTVANTMKLAGFCKLILKGYPEMQHTTIPPQWWHVTGFLGNHWLLQ